MIIEGTYNKSFLARGIQFFTGIMWPLLRFKKVMKTCNHFKVTTDGYTYEAVWPVVIKEDASTASIGKNVKRWYVPGHPSQSIDDMVGKRYQWNNFIFHIIKVFTGLWIGPVNARQLYCVEVVARALRRAGYIEVQRDWNNYQLERWLEKMESDPSSNVRLLANISEKPGKLLTFLFNAFQTISSVRIGKIFISFMTAGPIIYGWVLLWGLFKLLQNNAHGHIFWQNFPDYMFAGVLVLMVSFSFTDWIKDWYYDHFPDLKKKQ